MNEDWSNGKPLETVPDSMPAVTDQKNNSAVWMGSSGNPLTIHTDQSESLHYNFEGFPLYAARDELERYGYEARCHWHPDLEYIYIVSGSMDYSIDGHKVRLQMGQGIFVNACRLHYGFSSSRTDCTFIACVIHPDLFCAQAPFMQKWIQEHFGFDEADYMIFYPHAPGHQQVLQSIVQLQELCSQKPVRPLQILSAASDLLQRTADLLPRQNTSRPRGQTPQVFLQMAGYIRTHLDQKLTLDEIALAGAVSRAQCVRIFQQQTRKSPIQFLNDFRLNQAHHLLRDTSLSVVEIAMQCGFSSSSYFSRQYRRKYGRIPSAERMDGKSVRSNISV